jgi:2-keto-4-pentenoate hydratase
LIAVDVLSRIGFDWAVWAWFVNRLSQHGGEIQAGQFVMTGTTTGLHALESPHAATADFGLLGAVEEVFT